MFVDDISEGNLLVVMTGFGMRYLCCHWGVSGGQGLYWCCLSDNGNAVHLDRRTQHPQL